MACDDLQRRDNLMNHLISLCEAAKFQNLHDYAVKQFEMEVDGVHIKMTKYYRETVAIPKMVFVYIRYISKIVANESHFVLLSWPRADHGWYMQLLGKL